MHATRIGSLVKRYGELFLRFGLAFGAHKTI